MQEQKPVEQSGISRTVPLLIKARVMGDGAAFITFFGRGLEFKVKNDVLQMDMDREDMTALRDVLSVALAEK